MRAESLLRQLTALLALVVAALPIAASAADGHIDPSTLAHRHDLTIARHADTSFALSTAVSGVSAMSTLLQTCNSQVSPTQDVAAGVSVAISGSLNGFGTAGDGLDIITTAAEMSQVLASSAGHIKIVTKINYCGTAGAAVGCAPSGATMAVVAGLSAAETGETIVHELGHNKGLGHRNSPGNPIMKDIGFGGTEVDQTETAAYHAGGTADGKHRPVDLAFVIDDTGSMSQEIAGVRGALTSHLAGFTASDCKAFQLTTFKDNVTPRAPTTDLATIRGAVAGLSASGGGDCPEASAQAITQVQDEIRSRGRMLLATDASPHAGQSLAGAISALRGRGVRVDVLLSGDCAASGGAADSISHNTASETVAAPAGTVSAIAAYAELAEQTGGIFAYVPEVNTSASGQRRYENIGYNVMQSTQQPALILAQPGTAPRGARVSVLVQGGNTNFVPGTTLAVSGGGVAVESVVVRSATELVATLAVAADAALGFRDLDATSGTESALGVGTIEITTTPSAPTITSITANSARPGTTLEVTVLGAGTHFSASSVLDVGAGITASNIRAPSAQTLQATLQVASGASVGFRDVRVTTGSEVATESVTGPFFVAPVPGGAVPALTAVSPSSAARGTTLTLTISGANTHFVSGDSVLSVAGSGITVQNVSVTSETRLSAVVTIAPDAALGFRDVQVTSGSEVAAALGGLQITGGVPPQPAVRVPLLSPVMLALLAGALLLLAGHARRRRPLR